VKELKQLLYLAKMKFRKENPNSKNNIQQRGFKIKRKVRNPRKLKTGNVKKRSMKFEKEKA
jgi:hypothetical protein